MMNSIESHVYSLISPGIIEEVSKKRDIPPGWVALQPSYASICHADLRYFAGLRRPEALEKKLPMALLHEGIGQVVLSHSDYFEVGDRVAVVPNIPEHIFHTQKEATSPLNYSENNLFLGSGYDGLAQSILVHPEDCLVPLPNEIPDEIAVLSELSSVSQHAITHIKTKLRQKEVKVALFGDGPVGYLTAALLHYIYHIPSERFIVFGASEEKLDHFTFVRTANVQHYDFVKSTEKFDILIECTGGKFSQRAINQAIDLAYPKADLVFMGVTEELVPINTRDILEKGITVHGSSRSTTLDFQEVIKAMKNANYRNALQKILPEEMHTISNAEEFRQLMEDYCQNPGWHKTIIHFNWQTAYSNLNIV